VLPLDHELSFQDSNFGMVERCFLFSKPSRPALGAHTASWSMGTTVLSREIKRSGRDFDQSSPTFPSLRMVELRLCFPIRLHCVSRYNFTLITKFNFTNVLAASWRPTRLTPKTYQQNFSEGKAGTA
jgi:hypothetical protein